jgi:hypothetical protein
MHAGGLGKVYLRYRDTGTGRVEETNHPLLPASSRRAIKIRAIVSRFVACVAELAEVLRGSYWARNGIVRQDPESPCDGEPRFSRELPEWKEVADLVGRAQALAVVQLLSRDAPDSNADGAERIEIIMAVLSRRTSGAGARGSLPGVPSGAFKCS